MFLGSAHWTVIDSQRMRREWRRKRNKGLSDKEEREASDGMRYRAGGCDISCMYLLPSAETAQIVPALWNVEIQMEDAVSLSCSSP